MPVVLANPMLWPIHVFRVRSRFADLGFLATIVNAIGIHYVGGDAVFLTSA